MARLLAALLVFVLAGCGGGGGPAPPGDTVRIATGNPGGVYADYGAGYADLVERRLPGASGRVLHTGGSVDNLRMVAEGRADAGFALADSAADAFAGQAPFRERLPVVALAALYDNYVQLVVRDGSSVHEVGDLRGRRVSVGSEGSGTALIAERILTVAGLGTPEDLTTLRMDVRRSADALAAGRIDAFFWSGGLPTAAITDLDDITPVRLVGLGTVVKDLTREFGELYTETTVAAVVYRKPSQVVTVSVPNFLVVRRDMPQSRAYWLTRLLFEGQSRLIRAHPEARRLDRRSAIATHPLGLHPGAARWFRESHP